MSTTRRRPARKSRSTADVERRPIPTAGAALDFLLAGDATLTFVSTRSNARFTYRVTEAEKRRPEDRPIFFVKVLTSNDNVDGFSYLGMIREAPGGELAYERGRKAKIAADAPSAKAFAWAVGNLLVPRLPAELEVWHEGRCGRCNRKLTVPESIESGYGPECTRQMVAA